MLGVEKFVSIHKQQPIFLHVKTNDSITDLYIQYQLNKLITITDNLYLSLIYSGVIIPSIVYVFVF